MLFTCCSELGPSRRGAFYGFTMFFLSPPVQVARWAHMHRFPSVCLSVRLDLTENDCQRQVAFFFFSFSPRKVSTWLVVHWRHRRGQQNFCLQKSRMPLAGLVYLLHYIHTWHKNAFLFLYRNPFCSVENREFSFGVMVGLALFVRRGSVWNVLKFT